MAAVAPWDIFLVNHSHIDIGYTDRQEVIADYHAQFVDQAVHYATNQQPGRPRFKFTCEGFYQVEQFWKTATNERKQQFLTAVRAGDIELTAFYFHLNELLDQGHLEDSLRPAAEFAKQHALKLEVAMACDVNGFSWGMSDALYDAGVRYLSTNINTHHGGYPFNKPLTAFYWQTPKGNKILVWNGLAYHRANIMGLIGGQNPVGDPQVPGLMSTGTNTWTDVKDAAVAAKQLPELVDGLKFLDYPYDFLLLAGSACYTDNSPVADNHLAIAKEWNEKYSEIANLHVCTLREFFDHLEKKADEIPTFAGEWTDWWSDGVASAPRDTILFRNAQRTKRLIEKLDPLYEAVSSDEREQMSRALVMYAEHTFGFSHTRLWNVLYQQLFLRKSRLAIEADELAGAALIKVFKHRGERAFEADRPLTFKVINPSDSPRKAAARLMVDFWEGMIIRNGLQVVDEAGKILDHQVVEVPRGWHVVVVIDLPANGEVKLRLEPGAASDVSASTIEKSLFENEFYRIGWSLPFGIDSLVDKSSGTEVLNGEYGLGTPIRQLFEGIERQKVASARTKDVSALAAGTLTDRAVNSEAFPSIISVGSFIDAKIIHQGPVFTTVEFECQVAGATDCVLVATFYNALPQIDLTLRMMKMDETQPEGMYCALPFGIESGVWHLDKPGGTIRPGIDQLPGTCCDYYLVQAGMALLGHTNSVSVLSPDAALVHIGAMRLWQFNTSIEPSGTAFSWLTNNKWETNFSISCGGPMEFRFTIELGARTEKFADAALPVLAFRS